MSAVDAAIVRRPQGLPVTAFSHAVLWFAVFLGAFVFFEPAPYELFLALAIPAWALSNPTLPRTIAPLLTLMLVFLAGGLLSATQAKDIGAQPAITPSPGSWRSAPASTPRCSAPIRVSTAA